MKGFLWRHKFLLLIWIIVFAMAGYFAYILFFKSSGHENPYLLSNKDEQSEVQSAQTAENSPKEVKVGETVKDGDFEISVSKLTCDGETSIGDNQYARAEAEGEFCRVNVSIKNVSQQTEDLLIGSVFGFVEGNESERIAVHNDATQYAQADQSSTAWTLGFEPGKTKSGDLVFDVKTGEKLAIIELHGAQNSPGVKVRF